MMVEGIVDEVGASFEMQFVEQPGSIGADCFHAQCQLVSYLSYRMTLGQLAQDVELSTRQLVMGRDRGMVLAETACEAFSKE